MAKYGENGHISFDKLWQLMEKKKLNKTFLRDHGLHSNTISKLVKNENVTTEVICHLCLILGCQPSAIMEYIKPEKNSDDI